MIFFLIFFFWETADIFSKEGRYKFFEEMQKNMVAFKNFVSSFRTVARTPPALIVERGVAHPMTMEVSTLFLSQQTCTPLWRMGTVLCSLGRRMRRRSSSSSHQHSANLDRV